MKNTLPLLITLLITVPAFFIGKRIELSSPALESTTSNQASTPINPVSKGTVEILNGCGVPRLADRFASYLRSNNFDVKSIGDGRSWNYSKTLILSRTPETEVAKAVGELLNVPKVTFIRTDFQLYDVTVIIGKNYGETTYGQ